MAHNRIGTITVPNLEDINASGPKIACCGKISTLRKNIDHGTPMVVDTWVGDTNIHPQSAVLGADSPAISKAVGWGDFGNVDT